MNALNRLRQAFAAAREQHPGLTEEMSEAALQQILAALGGEQLTLPKTTQGRNGRPCVSVETQRAALKDLCGPESIDRIAKRHRVSRATLYRLMKRGAVADAA